MSNQSAMASPSSKLSLTLIVAATPSMGIGKQGTLPWPSLKGEMAYFARVTKRTPPPNSLNTTNRIKNAVIMGRKTWDSIPPKFRPLKDRVNVVITRNKDFDPFPSQSRLPTAVQDEVVIASSITDAVAKLEQWKASASPEEDASSADRPVIGHVFVIGGNTIYKAALDLSEANRILFTKIDREFECDTFFPVKLADEPSTTAGWTRQPTATLSKLVGEEVVDGKKEDKGIAYEFCLFERLK
jgi:dihydrofolate reductase